MNLVDNPAKPQSNRCCFNSGIFSHRNMCVGFFLVGSVVSVYIAYNYYGSFLNVSKNLFHRTLNGGLELSHRAIPVVVNIFSDLVQYVHDIFFKLIERFGLMETWNRIAGLSIRIGQSELFLGESIWYSLATFIPLYVINKLVQLLKLAYKIGIRNDTLLIWAFLWRCPSKLKANRVARKTLQKIATSDPWEALKLLKKFSNFSALPLDRQLSTAKYPDPEHLAKIVSKYKKFENQIIYYFGKYPHLYHGTDRSPFKILEEILSSDNCELILDILCSNDFLFKGNKKLKSECLSVLFINQNPQELYILKNWLCIFKDSTSELEKIANFSNPCFNENFAQAILKRRNEICQNNLSELCQMGYQGPLLNIEKFFDDPSITKWNRSHISSKDVSQREWEAIKSNRLIVILNFMISKDDNLECFKGNIGKFCENCLITRDAVSNDKEKENLKRRIAYVWSYLESCCNSLTQESLKNKRAQLIKKGQIIIEVLNGGGKKCPDGSLAFLIIAENLIKVFSHPEYMMNIFVNMFKHGLIQQMDKSEESAESYLFYLIKFNQILQLGVSIGAMLNTNMVKIENLGQVLMHILNACTPENLINYVANSEEFRLIFEIDNNAVLKRIEEIHRLIAEDIYGIEAAEMQEDVIARIERLEIKLEQSEIVQIRNDVQKEDIIRHLNGKLTHREIMIKHEFYFEKAKNLLLNAGFLTKT